MRIGSYLTLVILTSLLGGLALAGYFFSEHNKNAELTGLASVDKLIQKDIVRLNDGISVLLLNTDQILGSDNEFIIPSTLSQFTELIDLCDSNLAQFLEGNPATKSEQESIEQLLEELVLSKQQGVVLKPNHEVTLDLLKTNEASELLILDT